MYFVRHAANPHKTVMGECCSCQIQRGGEFLNKSEGLIFPHEIDQVVENLQRLVSKGLPLLFNPKSPSLQGTWLALVGSVRDKKAARCAAWDAMRTAEVYQKMRSLRG